MNYTISELAQLSGVSTRTLRYYDQIGLLKPAQLSLAGYRMYTEKEVDQLQQILFYKELDFPLDKIKRLVVESNLDEIQALEAQAKLLADQREHLDAVIQTIRQTIITKQRGIKMADTAKFKAFKQQLIDENEEQYGTEVRRDYGDAMVDESNRQLLKMSEAKYREFKELEEEILNLLAAAVATKDPSSDLAVQLVELHRRWLGFTWKNIPDQAYAGLADMYADSPDFTAYYDQKVAGGGSFLSAAMHTWLAD
ncbi:MerR family transcriptional regulator [Weissella kandleri]|uniref:MerR family transcriptional regulator n=1 Tax=Weissella kandleri TaxID=1616 RepID=UPI00387E7030